MMLNIGSLRMQVAELKRDGQPASTLQTDEQERVASLEQFIGQRLEDAFPMLERPVQSSAVWDLYLNQLSDAELKHLCDVWDQARDEAHPDWAKTKGWHNEPAVPPPPEVSERWHAWLLDPQRRVAPWPRVLTHTVDLGVMDESEQPPEVQGQRWKRFCDALSVSDRGALSAALRTAATEQQDLGPAPMPIEWVERYLAWESKAP